MNIIYYYDTYCIQLGRQKFYSHHQYLILINHYSTQNIYNKHQRETLKVNCELLFKNQHLSIDHHRNKTVFGFSIEG
jgi:hypothetical protein